MKISEKLGKKRIILIVAGGITAILVLIYVALGIYFNTHFGFRTIINGIDCSLKSVAQVEQMITEEINRYEIQLEGRGGQTEVIKSNEIQLTPVFDGSLNQELASRSGFTWIASLFRETTLEIEAMVTYDEELFEETVEALAFLKKENSVEPKDAYLSEYKVGKGYEIIPEEEGSLIDKKVLKEVLHGEIVNLKDKVSLDEAGCYVEPKIRSDDSKLVSLLEELNGYLSTEITYEFGDKTEVLNQDTLHKWIAVGKDNQVTIDEEQAAEYVKGLAETYDTSNKARSFTTTYGPTVTLHTNAYGWRIDREGEVEQLLADIKEGKQVSREPVYKQTARSRGSQDHGGTYVEINITAQHLYFYKNGSLVVESDFVSGNLSKGWGTPSGAFGLTYKQRDAVLRGEDYRTPVDYWMPFNGGIGLHDATWRSDFGGNYYKKNGSHGCINLPHSVAKKIFENIEAGDAVFVYELSGTEGAKAAAQDAAAAVMDVIDAIGDVTWESAGAIQAARAAYDSLDDTARGYVKNYDVLTNAEAVYAALVAQQQAAIQAQQQAQQQEAQARNQAQAVINAINAIGEVTLDKQAAIEGARSQYNGLSAQAKTYVTNLSVLEAAEARLQELLAGAGQANAGV